ncbi:hypothetical protein SOV92_12430 [Pectobacterium brasiliense]|uniref:Long-tail fiber proximal subunit trimerization domain-containing protein n=1 Tax=Pectobacterium brasiliense TaxID=180957 RepID=A0AAW9HBP7_9GAMM|nr:hypothetical protein [Pectobacterium brasiliense]MDY4378628.1 hypothetical protein [Pectobacterium brasiliense]
MANLPEQKEWIDGIYQLETSDPVIGGPGGISNRQAEQLAKRTAYLKEQQEKTGADLLSHTKATDPHTQYAPKASPALTGTPTAPTAAAGVNNAQIATTAYVMAAIAALVNGSPGALDTLKELAAALGNDPNFSTTILNELAQKLTKEQNGADIPDKAKFMANVGLKSAATRAVGTGASDIPDITAGDGRYLGKTATAVAATKLAAARKIAGIAFDGTADIALTPENIGALPAVGGTLTGNLISTVADVLRMVYGGYGAILRQDGGGVYILLTNKNDSGGGFNSLRPLRIDLATGNIEFGHTANASVLQEKGQRVYSPNNKPAAADIGALPADGTATAATKLSMARKIAGVAFDGTADIALTPANVGALPAAGTAVAATKLAVARKIAGVAFDGTADISLTSANVGAYSVGESDAKFAPKDSPFFTGSPRVSTAAKSNATTLIANTQFVQRELISGVAVAERLATARKINGVPFDGTADINLTPQNLGFGAIGLVPVALLQFSSHLMQSLNFTAINNDTLEVAFEIKSHGRFVEVGKTLLFLLENNATVISGKSTSRHNPVGKFVVTSMIFPAGNNTNATIRIRYQNHGIQIGSIKTFRVAGFIYREIGCSWMGHVSTSGASFHTNYMTLQTPLSSPNMPVISAASTSAYEFEDTMGMVTSMHGGQPVTIAAEMMGNAAVLFATSDTDNPGIVVTDMATIIVYDIV